MYPGQVLQVDLCTLDSTKDSFLHVDTHNANLPTSICMIAHRTELIQPITGYAMTFNFTIVVTETQKMCKLFLTALPCLYYVYETFYVTLMSCPVGFTLQNGVHNCDPYLEKAHLGMKQR